MVKQRPLTPDEQRQIASEAHVLVLDGLATKTAWTLEDLAFQGGTSLALAWDSPRFSEDLDFIVREDLNFDHHIKKVALHVEDGLQRNFPGAKVNLKEKESDSQNVYTFSVSLPNVLGNTKIKTEFWKVKNDYVKGYDRNYKMVARRGSISPQIPVASLDQIYADKMVALGSRERLKWRDIFDVWFLSSASRDIFKTSDVFSSWIEATLSLYNTTPDQLRQGWKNLLKTPSEDILKNAESDLKPFLSSQLWNKLYPAEISNMVEILKNDLTFALANFAEDTYAGMSSVDFKEKVLLKRMAGHDFRKIERKLK